MLTDIQQWWIEEHDYLFKNARSAKIPMSALFDMYKRYEALNSTEKNEVNNILINWVDKAGTHNINNDKLYTALACITKYEVVAAIPAMERLSDRLKGCKIPENPQGYYEREKILRKLEKLESIKQE